MNPKLQPSKSQESTEKILVLKKAPKGKGYGFFFGGGKLTHPVLIPEYVQACLRSQENY